MIEFLEPRIAPSGLIDVSFSHGDIVLKSLTGDAGDESATLTRVGESGIIITPAADVAIRFEGTIFHPAAPLSLTGFTGSLSAKLSGGNDTLILDGGAYPGGIRIDLGEGADTLEIRGGTVNFPGKTAISLGNGANQFTLSATDFYAPLGLTLKGGNGNDLLVFKSPKLATDRNLVIATGAGSDTVQFTSAINELTVLGNLTIAAKGSRSAIIEQSLIGLGRITIGGGLTLTAGTGDRVQQVLTGTIGQTSIQGDTAFSATNPTEHTQVLAGSGPNLTLHGKLRFTTHAITATQTLSATQNTLGFVAGKIALIGATAVVADFNGTLFSAITIDTAKNSSASVALSAAIIRGDTRIETHDTFGLTASISTQNITLQGALTIIGGIGATTVKINQTETTKALTIALKDGTNSFLIEQENLPGLSRFHGDVRLTGGIDVDTFTLGGTGNDHIEFLATVIANGKAGTDVFTEGEATTHPAGLTTVKVQIP